MLQFLKPIVFTDFLSISVTLVAETETHFTLPHPLDHFQKVVEVGGADVAVLILAGFSCSTSL